MTAMATLMLFTSMRVVATLPWIGWVAKEIGKDHVEVSVIVNGRSDPHKVYVKPSMILEMRRADVLMYNGLDLEIGYLPYLLEKSGNSHILPGSPGSINLSSFAPVILEKPKGKVTRQMGDVHPFGNPHYHLDPVNMLAIVDSVAQRLAKLDPQNASDYLKNGTALRRALQDSLAAWEKEFADLRGKKYLSYHKLYEYLAYRFGFKIVGYIEPKPGIPPTPGHIRRLVKQMKEDSDIDLILTSVYYDRNVPKKISSLTGVPYVVLPHDIGSTPDAKDYFSLIRSSLETLKRKRGNM